MRASKVLEMLESNRIEELKRLLQEEIYEESLKTKPGAKKRYAAMKRYFGYHRTAREVLQKPCQVEFEGTQYISFCNSWSLALTTEDCGEISLLDDPSRYPDVTRLLRFDGVKKKMDFNKIFAEARSKGYKLTKSEVGSTFKYLLHYDGTYYKLGLLEATFGIINDGEMAMVYHPDGERMPLTIKNDIGLCMIMPVKYEGDPVEDGKVVIEINLDKKTPQGAEH